MARISKSLKIQILHLLAMGYSVTYIAKKFNLTEWQVQRIKDPKA